MRFELTERLRPTDPRHADMVDAFAYMVASQEAKLIDDYVFLHLQKPWYMPTFFFHFLISKFVVLNRFK